jgi:cell wall-associated NlpC family hydrolase
VTTRLRHVLLVLALVCAAAATAGKASAAHARVQRAALGERAAVFARHLLGVPYRWGGTSPRTGFDCSGFVGFVYRHFGVDLPRTTYEQFTRGRRVSRAGLRPGDLVFFDGVGHVGLYVGHGRFIHAPHAGARVEVSSFSDGWYAATFDGARRLWTPPRTRPEVERPWPIPVAWRALRPG